MNDAVGFKRLWAKSDPRHDLWKHLLDTAAVSLELPLPALGSDLKPEHVAFLVGLHDIGKADSAFQHQKWRDAQGQECSFSKDLEEIGYRVCADPPCRHERISARFISELLTNKKDEIAADAASDAVADAISRAFVAHHGYWDKNSQRPVVRKYAEAQEELCNMLRQVLRVGKLPAISPPHLSAFGMRLAGHIVLCDWIASNERFFGDQRLQKIEDPEQYLKTAKEVAAQWVRDDLELRRENGSGRPCHVVQEPRPIQQVLLDSDIPPGLIIIEAPMGEGKTEAAWILAEKWRDKGYRGMYMALPTMATSDSLYGRYREDYLEKMGRGEDARLVHGMAWLRDDRKEPDRPLQVGEVGDDRSLATAWFRPTRRAMLAAHGVGTVDQAMLASMNVKFGFLRLYGLADRVLVIDEVHAYDAYMSAIIRRLLNWCACLEIPVILLSATLSARQKQAMIEAYGATGGDPEPNAPYPLITVAVPQKKAWTIEAAASSDRTLSIETHAGLLGNAGATAKMAVELVKDGGCCCVILNTVKQAQDVYTALQLPENEKMLFHSRFTAADREVITNRVLDMFGKGRWTGEGDNRRFKPAERPDRFVLVATQVVEQSLDVDFDHMISEIAPMDLLLQRSGRIKRHTRTSKGDLNDGGNDDRGQPVMHVLLPEDQKLTFGGTSYVYAAKPLLRTLAILSSHRDLRLPNDFREMIERCYGSEEWNENAVPWEVIREADKDWDSQTKCLDHQGRQFALLPPCKRFFQPVNNDPTGDDTDDGNGWRAKTRLGTTERTALLVSDSEIARLEQGELCMTEVRARYQKSVKLPSYLPISSPAPGYNAAVEAKGKLSGVVLLPVDQDKLWRGIDKNEHGDEVTYEVTYDDKLGLTVRRV